MNTANAKTIAWSVAGLLLAGLCLYVGVFLIRYKEVRVPVSTEEMQKVLDDTPEIVALADDIVPYKLVEGALIKANWTGKAPQPVAGPETVEVRPEPTKQGVETLVKVLGYSADGREPEASKVVIKYLDAAHVNLRGFQRGGGGVQVSVGDRLAPPIDHIRIVGVSWERGVEFAFDDEEREHEFLLPGDLTLEGRIVQVDPDAIATRRPQQFEKVKNWNRAPAQTERIGANKYRVGTEDSQLIAAEYSRILSEEVRLGRHRNPVTGRFDGVEVQTVRPDSVAARHGVRSGDVIKSINGTAVTSTQEAISYVKNNQNAFDRWEVVIENMGMERTVVYLPPPQE